METARMSDFNPYGQHSIYIPLKLVSYDGATPEKAALSWGAKVLFGRLALFLGKPRAGKESFCNPTLQTMAASMGVSVDTVGRFLGELISHGFIKRRRRGPGRPAECIFLVHPIFRRGDEPRPCDDSASLRSQERDSDSADLRSLDSAELPLLIPQPCGSDSAGLPCKIPQTCGSLIRNKTFSENIQENIQENGMHVTPSRKSKTARRSWSNNGQERSRPADSVTETTIIPTPETRATPGAASARAIPEADPLFDYIAAWNTRFPDRVLQPEDIGPDTLAAIRLAQLDDECIAKWGRTMDLAAKIISVKGAVESSWLTLPWLFRRKDGMPNWKRVHGELLCMTKPSGSGQKPVRDLKAENEQWKRERAERKARLGY
jgi:hypothetical protein